MRHFRPRLDGLNDRDRKPEGRTDVRRTASLEPHCREAHMKALVVNAFGRGFDLEDVDIASPIGREVLIDVRASGLCHTDLLFAANNIAPFPAVFGHEVSGIVVQVGPDVTQFRAGEWCRPMTRPPRRSWR
jgi:Alcohol dehydrogenase GroES-like domain